LLGRLFDTFGELPQRLEAAMMRTVTTNPVRLAGMAGFLAAYYRPVVVVMVLLTFGIAYTSTKDPLLLRGLTEEMVWVSKLFILLNLMVGLGMTTAMWCIGKDHCYRQVLLNLPPRDMRTTADQEDAVAWSVLHGYYQAWTTVWLSVTLPLLLLNMAPHALTQMMQLGLPMPPSETMLIVAGFALGALVACAALVKTMVWPQRYALVRPETQLALLGMRKG
jgi:hypothetical protein